MIHEDAYKAAIELAGTLDSARFDLTEARQDLKMTVAEHARILQHISPELRAKLNDIAAWLLDVEAAVRNAEDECGQVLDLISPDADAEVSLRNLARMVLDVDRGISDPSELRRAALDAVCELGLA